MNRLALGLGWSVTQLEQGMSGRELVDWMEYYRVEPWGAFRDNLHAGIIAAQVVNMTPRKNAKPVKATDFLIEDREERQQKNMSGAVGMLRAIAKRKKK